MKLIKKRQIEFSGQIGNYILRHNGSSINHPKGKTEKEWNDFQSKIDLECDMVSEYLTDEVLNNEHFQLLDIDLERFVSDTEYYFDVFENRRDIYDLIIGWFSNEVVEYWTDIRDMFMGEGLSDKLYNVSTTLFNKHYDEIDFKPLVDNNGEEDQKNSLESFYNFLSSHYSETSVRKSIERKDNLYGWDDDLTKSFGSKEVV